MRSFFICLFLTVSTTSVYLQVANFDFVNLDDHLYVFENYHVQKGFTLENISWALTAEVASNWHPLTLCSHMLDCQLYGLNSGYHHLTNLFLHIANALLLFAVFKRMTGALWRCAFVATLFALHPLHVESVAWVAERKDVLSTFFWILTMWAYVRYVKHPGGHTYLTVLFFFILGLMAKPMIVTLPFLLLLLDYWPLKRYDFKQGPGWGLIVQGTSIFHIIIEKIPLFILTAISCIITYNYQEGGDTVSSIANYPLDQRILNASVSYVCYLKKMIWPFKLAAFYPHPGILPLWQVSGAITLLILITFFSLKSLKRHPFFAVGWLWYIGTLVPVIGLVQVGEQAMADRYTYVPLIGIFIIIVWGIPMLLAKWPQKNIYLTTLFPTVILILIPVTWIQVGHWKNTISLFEHAINLTDGNHLAHHALALSLAKFDKTDEAIRHLNEALRIKPVDVSVRNKLGELLSKQGKTDEAIRHFSFSIGIDPEQGITHLNLGALLSAQGHIEKAFEHLKKGLRLCPDHSAGHTAIGAVYAKQNKLDSAIKHYSKALKTNPKHFVAHHELGILLANQGKMDEAMPHFSEALKINPASKPTHIALGSALAIQEDYKKAIVHLNSGFNDPIKAQLVLGNILWKYGRNTEATYRFNEVIRLDPTNAIPHQKLGDIMKGQGKIQEAIIHYGKALELKPNFKKAQISLSYTYFMMGGILIGNGEINDAIVHLQKALQINNDFAEAHDYLAFALLTQGKENDAMKHCHEAIRIDPEKSINAYYNLSCIYARKNRPKESIEWLKMAIEKGFNDWDSLKTDKDMENIRSTGYYAEIMNKYTFPQTAGNEE